MKTFLALLLVLVCPLAAQGGPPTRPVTGLMVTTTTTQSTTFWVKGAYRYVNPLPDSAITSVLVGAAAQATHRLRSTVTRDSFALAKPAAGVTITGSFCVQTKRRAAADTSVRVCAPWSFTTPQGPLPPPIIDSVKTDTVFVAHYARPSLITFTGAGTAPMCNLVRMGGGQVGYRGVRVPFCDSIAASLGPAVKPTQQARIDRACFSMPVEAVNAAVGWLVTTMEALPCASLTSISVSWVGGFLPYRSVRLHVVGS